MPATNFPRMTWRARSRSAAIRGLSPSCKSASTASSRNFSCANSKANSSPLDQLETSEILRVHHPDGAAGFIEHHKIINPVLFEKMQHFDRQLIRANGDRTARHKFAHRPLQQI